MRIFSSLIFICLFCQSALTQTSRPSQKEIQSQLHEARQDAEKQIADLEKEIADAKSKGESAESIKDMETQLAMLKKMLGVIDKAGSQSTRPKAPELTRTVPLKFVSPFVPVLLKQPVKTPSQEQAGDQLFWYTGKKIDANTLVTPDGLIVWHDRPNNRLIVQPDKQKDTFYYGLVNTLAQTAKMKNDFVAKVDGIKNSFFMFPEILMAYTEFDAKVHTYYDLAKNTIDLGSPSNQDLETMRTQLLAKRDALIEMMSTLPPVTPGSLVAAPERPHGLCWCDTIPIIAFRDRLPLWTWDFYREELALWSKIVEMSSQMQEFLEKGGKAIPNWNATIFKAKSLKIERESEKLLILIENYENEKNIYKEDALADAAVTLRADLKNFQSILPDDDAMKEQAAFRVRRAKDIVTKKYFNEYIEDQKSQRNFDVVFDYSTYASHEYNKRLFDLTYDVPGNLVDIWIKGLDKFNRFTLTITMDFELHMDDKDKETLMTADGFLKSDPVIVSLGQFNCKWQLYNKDLDQTDRTTGDEPFHIPLKVMQGRKDYLKDKFPPFLYTGPDHMQMVFPQFRISFCRDGSGIDVQDSAYLDVLRYGDADLARYKNTDVATTYTIDMLAYANKMLLGIIKTKGNEGELIDIAGKMIDVNEPQQMNSTGNPILDQLMMEFFTNQKKVLLQGELSGTSHTGNTVIPFDAKNTTHVLMQETYSTVDRADLDREAGINLIRGLITMRVQHTPL